MVLCSASRNLAISLSETQKVVLNIRHISISPGAKFADTPTYRAVLCMLVCLQMCAARGIYVACEKKKSHVVPAP